MKETIFIFLSGTGVLVLIFYGATWLLKESTKKLLEKAIENHKNQLSKELESYKRDLDLKYEHALSLQDRRLKLFEEFSESLEEVFKTEGDDLSFKLNRLFGLLSLYASDDVYKSLKKALEGKVLPNQAKPIVYATLRNSLFGANSKLTQDDLSKHIVAKHINIETTSNTA